MSFQEEQDQEKINDKKNKGNILDKYGVNLTRLALNGELDPIIGRDKEINRATQILSRKKKNNLIVVGNPGTGKSSLVLGIAQKIIKKEVTYTLQDKEIYSLELSAIVAGTKYRGQFEERMVELIKYLKENKHIIIFFDEIHTILGAGGSTGSLDAANILKPALANGSIHCIGATTYDEYRENIEKDGALARRFQKINFDEPTIDETKQILKSLKTSYEKFHNVTYDDDLLDTIPELATKFIADRFLPDSAIDILDETGAKAQIESIKISEKLKRLEKRMDKMNTEKIKLIKQKKWDEIKLFIPRYNKLEEDIINETILFEKDLKTRDKVNITEGDILEIVSSLSNVPLDKLKKDGKDVIKLIQKMFKEQMIGQDEAVEKIIKALKRSIMGMSNPNKPIVSMLLLGKTGTGKTFLAQLLSQGWYDKDLIRVDMSEFMEKHSASKLIGSPPGYVGFESAGQLTEKVRQNPYSLILLDEIEKAHPDTLNILLQMLDDGHLTDGQGRKVNFRNCIIIMTSNLGARKSQIKSVGFGNSAESDKEKLVSVSIEEAKNHFSPEIWNRIDQKIVFNPLEKEDIAKILELDINKIKKLLKPKNIKLKIGAKVKEKVIEEGYSEEYGARHLTRTVESMIKDPVTDYMFEEDCEQDCTLSLKWDNDIEEIIITKL